jgi:bis(5'-nucleosyl)-tetraphosphatase (symmetrical)
MSTYVFGDIQGCFDELQTLLDVIHYDQDKDELWFVGDLINRGKKNLETLNFIMKQSNAVVVLGNHDLHFLACATGNKEPTRKDTLSDVLGSPDLPAIIDWLIAQPLVHHDPEKGYTMAHAGLPPHWSIDQCLQHAAEVERCLQGDNSASFFQQMYGNDPNAWSDSLEGMERLRMITNYFTRMRFCTADGILELTHKTTDCPRGYSPWFDFYPTQSETTLLFGHWAALEGITNNPSVIALDTGCIWGNQLTALRLEDKRFFSTPAHAQAKM